ncbi:uncharacterized protein LOC119741895 [Patiria miniata]|uniref:Epidermal cell surface receptor n=1 Tax=Patiria miniata TaxID=46514 RepID=A0A914BD39_PATMI|nr:uncharacterized protein LOC119741895 [Patiria miniata]
MFLGSWRGSESGGLISTVIVVGCAIALLILNQRIQPVRASSPLGPGPGPLASRDGSGAQDASCPREFRGCNWYCPSLPERCIGERLLPDPCRCCTLCMKQTGERCSLPREACDAAFQLDCVEGRCKGPMNVQIRSASATSINLSWDAFLPAGSDGGHYVVYFTSQYTETISGWPGVIEVGNATFASIRDLQKGLAYYFRVSYRLPRRGIVMEGPLSEVALHQTGTPAPTGGCEHDATHYDEGQTIQQSCDTVCDCLLGRWICRPRSCPPSPDVVLYNPINCREVPHPDDPHCCQMIECDEGPSEPLNPADCTRNDVVHRHGETYYLGCEEVCHCDNGVESCTQRCPEAGSMLPDSSSCPQPQLNTPPDGECCPYWTCPPPPGSCEMNGNTYEEDEYFDIGCSMRCQCKANYVACLSRCPYDFRAPTEDCPEPKQVQVPGECCMQWECPTASATTDCVYFGSLGNITMANGEWIDEGCDQRCLCDHGSLVCMPVCVSPSPPSPTPLCPTPVITKLRSEDCCEVIACHDPKQQSPNVVRDVSVFSFNDTSITVAFAPPANDELLSSLDGYIIQYTDSAQNVNPETWKKYRKDFPAGIRVRGHIIIEITGLSRRTTYYLQIRVSIPDRMEPRWPNTLPATDTIVVTTVENAPQPCTYKSQVYQHSERFYDGCESSCECKAGRTICRERCPVTELLPSYVCPNPQRVVVEGQCCPEWRCLPKDGDCSHGGNIYLNGMQWRQGCDLRCSCDSGEVSCHNLCSTTPPAATSDCPYPVQVSVPDTCCKEWLCYDTPQPAHGPIPSLSVPLSSFQMNITAKEISAYQATISWPPMTDVQRRYIARFRLKYKELSYGVKDWATTVELRASMVSYTMLDLRPARSYVVQLVVLVGDPTVAIHLPSNKVEVDTLWIPSKPYPGRPFKIEAETISTDSITVRWTMLPVEIAQHIIGWRLMVTDAQDSRVVLSDIVEPTALSTVVGNLTQGTVYHLQLLGLWDNGTLTREVRSQTLVVKTNHDQGTGKPASFSSAGAIGGALVAIFVLVALVAIVVYIRVRKSRYSKRYDVYMHNTTVNYDTGAGYEQVYSSTASGLDEDMKGNGLTIRRDSEAGLLDAAD